jgi:5'-nucleotidase
MENDPNISIPEKVKIMEEWATNSRKILRDSGLNRSVIVRAVSKALSERAAELREKVDRFYNLVEENKVPMLIFSAGVSDILEEVLKVSLSVENTISAKPKTTYVVSNRCIFEDNADESSPLVGFSMPIIHVFNKKSATFAESPFFKETDEASRDNVILLGDSVGDLLMVEGMSHNPDHLLRIGFLNVNVEERLKQYTDLYDIVIARNESSFVVPAAILTAICQA